MKIRYYPKISFIVFIGVLVLSAATICRAEEITLTTYYPSPYGVYSEMRLYPKLASTTPCVTGNPNSQPGVMFYDSDDRTLKVCVETSPGVYDWQRLGGGFWAANGNNIYNTNLGNVGIGTNNPAERLDVAGSAHFSDKLKSGNLSVANNIIAVAGGTETGGLAVGFNNGSGVLIAKNPALSVPGIGILGPGGVPAIGMSEDNPSRAYLEAYLGRDLMLMTDNALLYLKNSNGYVGIGKNNPAERLDVLGNANVSGSVKVGNLTSINNGIIAFGGGGFNVLSIGGPTGSAGFGQSPATGEIGLGLTIGTTAMGSFYYSPISNAIYMQSYGFRPLILNGGKVGIGIGPWAQLDVYGSTINVPGFRTLNSAYNRHIFMVPELGPGGYNWLSQNGDSGIFFSNLGAGLVIGPWVGSNAGMRMTSFGFVGIGVALPGYQLQLSLDSAAKPNGGSWANSSDERLKTNIKPLTGALEKITALKGVQFEWKNPDEHASYSGEARAGFLAQEVEEIFPHFIKETEAAGKDRALTPDGKIKSLSLPFDFDAYLVEAIKEQQKQIEELRAENNTLKTRLDALEQKLK